MQKLHTTYIIEWSIVKEWENDVWLVNGMKLPIKQRISFILNTRKSFIQSSMFLVSFSPSSPHNHTVAVGSTAHHHHVYISFTHLNQAREWQGNDSFHLLPISFYRSFHFVIHSITTLPNTKHWSLLVLGNEMVRKWNGWAN